MLGSARADPSDSSVLAFTDETIPGGVIQGSEWHSHLGSMKVQGFPSLLNKG